MITLNIAGLLVAGVMGFVIHNLNKVAKAGTRTEPVAGDTKHVSAL